MLELFVADLYGAYLYLCKYSCFVISNVALQKGSSDCGLYVIAMMAYDDDPITQLYSQWEL